MGFKSSDAINFGAAKHRSAAWLFLRMALQNLLRRPARTFMLIVSVALGTGAVFASFIVAHGIESSMQRSFSRMGADLIVVPEDAMVNITSALLTVQPTEATFDRHVIDEISHIDGVAQLAPQTFYHVPMMAGMPMHKANLIAFDPKRDFTVLPWLAEHMPRVMQTGDILCGGRRAEAIGDEIEPCNNPATVYGRLGRSGVGPLDESMFATYDTVAMLARDGSKSGVSFDPKHISALLVRLDFGATPEQVRFAIARIPGVKVIVGASIVTSTRQTTTVLFGGMIGFTVLMLIGSLILVGLLFSAIIAERGREIGLLRAIGTRRGDVVSMLVAEAGFATGIGGACGILLGCALLLLFQHSLVYYLETLHVEFAWPDLFEIGGTALGCALVAGLVGMLGAFIPAWRAGGAEPYRLIQGESESC